MEYINLTSHDINLYDANDRMFATFPPSGTVARIDNGEIDYEFDAEAGLRISVTQFDSLLRTIPREEGVTYIVSLVTALGCRRDDFVYPRDEVRDENRRIIGCRQLARVYLDPVPARI